MKDEMKKKLYYVLPFVAVPLLLLICDMLDNMNILQMSSYIGTAVLLFFSVVMGFFSTTNKTFDYLLTAIMPLSFFCCMFVLGFFDMNDAQTIFSLHKAVKAAFQPICLQLYFLMGITAFLASFKRFRNVKK